MAPTLLAVMMESLSVVRLERISWMMPMQTLHMITPMNSMFL